MSAVDATAVLNTPTGAAHRQVTTDRALCGGRILPGAVVTNLLACATWGVPVCPGCWPARSSVYGGVRTP